MELMIAVLALFAFASYQDIKKREVDDLPTIGAWLASAFLFDLHFFVLSFSIAWLIASLSEKFKMPLAGFGDVLWFPVFASLVVYTGGNALLMGLIAVLISQVYLWYRVEWLKTPKEGNYGPPFVLVMLLVAAADFILRAFLA